jgi:hypothetical protein
MKHPFLVALSGLLLSCATTPLVPGQDNVPITRKQENGRIVDRSPKARGKSIKPSSNSLKGVLPPDTPDALQPHSILVRIRYRKELGYLELRGDPFTNKSLPNSCRAFDVNFTAPDASGNNTRIGSTMQQDDQMKEDAENGLYSCWFTVSDIPFSRRVLVLGSVINNPSFLTQPWLGGSEVSPPLGSDRIVRGNERVMLTTDHPSVVVDMVMDYRGVRPLNQKNPSRLKLP